MLTIDGSKGEGGGQVLRTSLALSLVTGDAVRLTNIRARRARPGLMRQHLTALMAAVEVSDAAVSGASLGSTEVTFHPGSVRGGTFSFSVGTAGSATLVLQTVLPALIHASSGSDITLEGGTHNPLAPPFDFLSRAFLPLLGRMGVRSTAALIRPGFYPAGGGKCHLAVEPVSRLQRIDLLERGELRDWCARAIVSALPKSICDRELRIIGQAMGWSRAHLRGEVVSDAVGPGNAVLIDLESEQVTEVFSQFGEKRLPAEQVAIRAVQEAQAYLRLGVPVGPHLADQLLLPFALAGGGAFRTAQPTMHTRTQADVIRAFLGTAIEFRDCGGGVWEVVVGAVPIST